MISGVDLLEGLARMASMDVLRIPGVTDDLDNDYVAQTLGAMEALLDYELVVIHIEAPDEAAHDGSIANKISAIEAVDREVVSRLRFWKNDSLRMLIMPDHPTPIETQTHSSDPVPFLLWGTGSKNNGANRFTETEAKRTGLLLDPGHNIMGRLVAR
jgi:2,3-bisphosphoglycerate-independent phosphoglycerate mutase